MPQEINRALRHSEDDKGDESSSSSSDSESSSEEGERTDAFSQLLTSHGHNLKLQKTQDGDDAAVKKLKPVLNPSLSQNMFVNFDANISSTNTRSDSRW